jgi:hypothetical protein
LSISAENATVHGRLSVLKSAAFIPQSPKKNISTIPKQHTHGTDEGWRSLAFHWSDNFYFYLGEALFAALSF